MRSAKICIVSMDNVKRVPYITQYLNCLRGKPFDFVFWDRDCTYDEIGADKSFGYRHRVRHGESNLVQMYEKLTGYIAFRQFASNVLVREDYERVVCLTGNCAVLVSKVLLSKYARRYIIDIRDYWHEDNRKYHETEQRLIEASAFPVISSPAYREFLGDHDFRIMHNSQLLSSEDIAIVDHPHNVPLHVVCVGAAKNLAYDCKVIDYFANDDRFRLSFRGRGYDCLKSYISRKGITNVEATGEFDFSRTMEMYRDADIILSMYGNGSPYWDYALANKLYFAAQLGLPILVCEKTAMADIVNEYNLGIAFDPTDTSANSAKRLIARLFDSDVVDGREAGCCRFLRRVECDNTRTFTDIAEFFDC